MSSETSKNLIKAWLTQLNKNRRVSIMLVFIGIASFFWFLRALDETYTSTVKQAVVFTNLPGNKLLANTLPSELLLKVKGEGTQILRHNWDPGRNLIEIDLSDLFKTEISSSGNSSWSISSRKMNPIISARLNDLIIVSIAPDSLHFSVSELVTRKIPVVPDISIEVEKQFMVREEVRVSPDSIDITGPALILDTLTAVSTEALRLKKLDRSVTRNLSIRLPDEQMSTTIKRVNVEISIEQFTEKILQVPIMTVNVPDSLALKTFPAAVEVVFRVVLSAFDQIDPTDFMIVADYLDIEFSTSRKLKPRIEMAPSLIEHPKIQPELVDYLLENK